MDTAIVTTYCLVDDWLRARRHSESPLRTLSDAEILTTALVAARFFKGNFEQAATFLDEQRYLPTRLSRSRFNRRLHAVAHLLESLFDFLADIWRTASSEPIFLIDSFPVAVCDNIRIKRCRLYPSKDTGDAFRGYQSSKRRYFYGLKVHLVVNADGRPVEVSMTPGSYSDTAQLRTFDLDLPAGSVVYGDKAYNEYLTEDLMEEASGTEEVGGAVLRPIRKKNSTRGVSASMHYVQNVYRKRVETAFSLIERMLPKSIHATTARGFEIKVFLFVLALSIDGLV
jgi:hypothetical protein